MTLRLAGVGQQLRTPARVLSLCAAMLAALLASGSARCDPINELQVIGVTVNAGGNNLSQIGLALHSGSYVAGDGSVRTVTGDGSVRTISVDPNARAALCFHDVTTSGSIHDGSSNTILFSQTIGLRFTGASPLAPAGVRSILDGSSNTLFFPETLHTSFCISDARDLDPVSGPGIADGSSNTITFGETSSVDLCLTRARLPSILDGTSNTILLGETRNGVCFDNIRPSADLTVVAAAIPEPPILVLMIPPLLAIAARRRRT